MDTSLIHLSSGLCLTEFCSSQQDCLKSNCCGFIVEDHWPQNFSDLNPPDNHMWEAMLNTISCRHSQKNKRIDYCIGVNMEYLPMESINKAIKHVKRDSEQAYILMGTHCTHILMHF